MNKFLKIFKFLLLLHFYFFIFLNFLFLLLFFFYLLYLFYFFFDMAHYVSFNISNTALEEHAMSFKKIHKIYISGDADYFRIVHGNNNAIFYCRCNDTFLRYMFMIIPYAAGYAYGGFVMTILWEHLYSCEEMEGSTGVDGLSVRVTRFFFLLLAGPWLVAIFCNILSDRALDVIWFGTVLTEEQITLLEGVNDGDELGWLEIWPEFHYFGKPYALEKVPFRNPPEVTEPESYLLVQDYGSFYRNFIINQWEGHNTWLGTGTCIFEIAYHYDVDFLTEAYLGEDYIQGTWYIFWGDADWNAFLPTAIEDLIHRLFFKFEDTAWPLVLDEIADKGMDENVDYIMDVDPELPSYIERVGGYDFFSIVWNYLLWDYVELTLSLPDSLFDFFSEFFFLDSNSYWFGLETEFFLDPTLPRSKNMISYLLINYLPNYDEWLMSCMRLRQRCYLFILEFIENNIKDRANMERFILEYPDNDQAKVEKVRLEEFDLKLKDIREEIYTKYAPKTAEERAFLADIERTSKLKAVEVDNVDNTSYVETTLSLEVEENNEEIDTDTNIFIMPTNLIIIIGDPIIF